MLFLTLQTFSATGGIEKVSRAITKILDEWQRDQKVEVAIFSLYDYRPDRRYVQQAGFRGFKGQRWAFVWKTWCQGRRQQLLLLSHVNLFLPALLVKLFRPRVKLVLLAHGIEVWNGLNWLKRYCLHRCDSILAVSNYTRCRLLEQYRLSEEKVSVLNNPLDPFFGFPATFEKPAYLLRRYGLQPRQQLLFTLTRLSAADHYKGVDHVLAALRALVKKHPNIYYLIGGYHEVAEKERLDRLIQRWQLQDHVQWLGFINERELVDHFLLADLFVMPSKNEGFGMVFIEALACGLPVIAGNRDGSVDAFVQGALGRLVDPEDNRAIQMAIAEALSDSDSRLPERRRNLQQTVQQRFGYATYRGQLAQQLLPLVGDHSLECTSTCD